LEAKKSQEIAAPKPNDESQIKKENASEAAPLNQSAVTEKEQPQPQNNTTQPTPQAEETPKKEAPKGENPFVMTVEKADGWTDDELKEYSARPQSIINKAADAQSSTNASSASPKSNNDGVETKADELFQRFSVSYNKKDEAKEGVIDDLNKTVKTLRNEVSELEVKLKLRDKELEEVKKENERLKTELMPNLGTPEGKRIGMLEEEKQKLKKEIDDIWQKVETQEADLQKKNLELKKLDEIKAMAEKYKNEKSSLSKQLKELQNKFNQSNITIMELQHEKEDEKQKFEKTLRESEAKGPERFGANEQQTLKDLVEFARTSMDEMQTKINYYKEKSDSIEKLERDLNEKKSMVVKLEVELQEKVSETKRKLELEHEDEKRQIEETHRKEVESIESRYKELVKSLENEVSHYKNVQFNKTEAESKIETLNLEVESLKTNNEILNGLCGNLQTLKEDNEKKISQLRCEVEDLQIRCEMLKKHYSKPR